MRLRDMRDKVKVGDVILYSAPTYDTHESKIDPEVPCVIVAIGENSFTLKQLFNSKLSNRLGDYEAEVIGYIDPKSFAAD